MYGYTHDPETGGLLLSDELSQFSKEPRPVYARELDILGFDAFWKYETQDEVPYLWAEANCYWYRGKRVAKTVGGSLYEKPGIELEHDADGTIILPEGSILEKVDIAEMVKKNELRLAALEQLTVKKIYATYHKYEKKLDCFHVAFSGGKDSIVLLELVKRALPRSSFMVVFGDTGMEFPDTYRAVDEVETRCKQDGIAFYRAASHFKPEESWKLFGPPSRVLRWCCTVHKSVPQTLKIREILGKRDYTGMAIVGVRGHESATRAGYEYENFGKKQKGQYSFNPILEWTSAEVWLYSYFRRLVINEAYYKGCARVGCLFCPLGSGGKSDFFQQYNYPAEVRQYTDLVKNCVEGAEKDWYLSNGGWVARRNGRDIRDNRVGFSKEVNGDKLILHLAHPISDYNEWLKTIGEHVDYDVVNVEGGIDVVLSSAFAKTTIGKRFQQCFVKASCCIGCRECEANCNSGALSFSEGLHIEGCIHCGQCHSIEKGCLVYHSLNKPQNEGIPMKSLNTLSNHAPKLQWITEFFTRGEEYLVNHSLGRMQIAFLKRFLTDANLIEKNKTTKFFELIKLIGITSQDTWSILLIQLANNNPQIQWYVKNMQIDHSYTRQEAITMLTEQGQTVENASQIIASAYRRICDLPFGSRLNFGKTLEKGKSLISIVRTKPVLPTERVFLYGLYRFAESCGGYYEFNLSRLLDFTIESEGISPAEIFAMTRDEVEQILNGLSRSHAEFISFATTHDLELIHLAADKKSSDVLDLFK